MTPPPAQLPGTDNQQGDDLPAILAGVKAAGRTNQRDYRRAGAIASNLRAELRVVDSLLAAGSPESAVAVLECGIKLIERAFATVDDSNGSLGDLIRRLQQDHADACELSGLDRPKLAARLAKWALGSDYEVFLNSPTTHATALGHAGLDRFEAEVDKHFSQLGALGPGESDERGGKVSSFNVTFLKTQLATRRGADAVVEVMARDLSFAYRYLQIAEVLAAAGRDDEAMSWLEQGQSVEFDRHGPDRRLADLIADLHFRAERFSMATDLVAARFSESPSAEAFGRLRDFAIASADWPARRGVAITLLSALPAAPALDVAPRFGSNPVGHTELVRVLLAEGDVEGAWNAARQGGCTTSAWADLADARGPEHPADAMTVYQLLAIKMLLATSRDAYQRAGRLINRAHRFAETADLAEWSRNWILAVRADNRRRPSLQDEFDRLGLPRA